jgi:hypothetical protein
MSTRPAAEPRSFRFKIDEYYDDHELSDLFEILEERGAVIASEAPIDPGWFTLEIPEGNRWIPFLKTVRECPSIAQVRGTGKTITYVCEPEG